MIQSSAKRKIATLAVSDESITSENLAICETWNIQKRTMSLRTRNT